MYIKLVVIYVIVMRLLHDRYMIGVVNGMGLSVYTEWRKDREKSSPARIRTGVTGARTRHPWPLDYGAFSLNFGLYYLVYIVYKGVYVGSKALKCVTFPYEKCSALYECSGYFLTCRDIYAMECRLGYTHSFCRSLLV